MQENLGMSFESVTKFEDQIGDFFGAKYAVATDSCTHALELCIRYTKPSDLIIPVRTYLSVAFLPQKLNINYWWSERQWQDYYHLTDNIIDAAVLWKRDSYIPGTMMCLSFQYQKHLSLGRGGMILVDDFEAASQLKKMSYDGRLPNIPWRDQNIDTVGYHYYMTPETAELGLEKLPEAIDRKPKVWEYTDWPDLRQMDVFK